MSDIRSLLERLSNTHGISGREGYVQEVMAEELAGYVDDIRIDVLGNLIATKKGGRPSIMLDAHMDEIGLMVKFVDEKGFIRFIRIGGWYDPTLLNQRVVVYTDKGPIYGVIGSKPPHVMKEDERKKPIDARDMFIDIGATSHKEVEDLGIGPGTPIAIDRIFKPLIGDRVTGKAFDNRAGVAMIIEALRRTKSDCTIYVVGAVEEEVGLKGARTSAFELNPDIALVADVTIPGDHPGIEKRDSALEMGKGPVITIADASGRGLIADPKIIDWIVGTAKENGIDIQIDAAEGGTTDATAIQLTRSGIPTGVISVATRYIHSPVEVLSITDLDRSADLMARALETAPKYFKI